LGAGEAIEFNGRKYQPDSSKAYFMFQMARGFPSVTAYGTGFHPNVVASHFRSLLHQNINREHRMAIHTDGKQPDAIIGSVVDVDFPSGSNWQVQGDVSKAPIITGVGALFKNAVGLRTIVGEHQTGRHKYAVSMECDWMLWESGFVVERRGEKPTPGFKTPPDLWESGWEYIDYIDAPEELRSSFSVKKKRVVSLYKGRSVRVLMGGLNKPIHFSGMAVVRYGAEGSAAIMRLAASDETSQALGNIAEGLKKFFSKIC
jgi:hypothetical protein